MKAPAENYKGIEYVRICALPSDQKAILSQSLNQKLIISIQRGDAILKDCLQYSHYITWYENVYQSTIQENLAEQKMPARVLTLALK